MLSRLTILLALTSCTGALGDSQFSGADAGQELAISFGSIEGFGRTKIIAGVADPDVFVSGDDVYVMGTLDEDTSVLPIWKLMADGFKEITRLRPSDDPGFDYCHVWGPDLSQVGGKWALLFVATQVPNGSGCDGIGIKRQQVFYSESPLGSFTFSPPIAPDFGPGAPRSVPAGCPNGCEKAIRIDPSLFVDTDQRVYASYTWFQNGNHNATIALDNPTNVIVNSHPLADEEGINEGPQIFKRKNKYYLLYSVGNYLGNYRMRYIVANSVAELTEEISGSHELTVPVFRRDGHRYETMGHGSIAEHRGQFYAVYHLTNIDSAGNFANRDTVISPVLFNDDGSIQLLNALDLSWSAHTDYEYSIDVRSKGSWIAPCADAGVVGRSTNYRLTSLCPANDQPAPLDTIDRIRVCGAPAGDWSQATCHEMPWNRDSDKLFIP